MKNFAIMGYAILHFKAFNYHQQNRAANIKTAKLNRNSLESNLNEPCTGAERSVCGHLSKAESSGKCLYPPPARHMRGMSRLPFPFLDHFSFETATLPTQVNAGEILSLLGRFP